MVSFTLASFFFLVLISAATAMQIPWFPPGRGGGGGGRGGPGGPSYPNQPVVTPSWDYPNRIVLIRHAEKPGGGGYGLSEMGKQRAECLRSVFGSETSDFTFGLIFAAPRDAASQDQERTWMTVAPLARDLGLTIETSCANDPPACIAKKIEEFAKTSDNDILISWKHHDLLAIARALGAETTVPYPDDRNDIMWIMEDHQIVQKRSEHCPVIDDKRQLFGDPELELI